MIPVDLVPTGTGGDRRIVRSVIGIEETPEIEEAPPIERLPIVENDGPIALDDIVV